MDIVNPELTIQWVRRQATGKGVTVAVIDSGIDAVHPDVAGAVRRACVVRALPDGTATCEEIPPDRCTDSYGHGTSVAGAILAVAPEAELVSVKVLNEYNQCTGVELMAGLDWTLGQNIRLVNMSLATAKRQFVEGLFGLCERAYRQNTIIVASKRNFGPVGWPAWFSSVISVDRDDFPERYRVRHLRYGPVEFAGHGTNVKLPALRGGYELRTGTSFATPHVTGVVALLRQLFPDLLAWEAKTILKSFFPVTLTAG